VRLLLDTHAFLFAISEPESLSAKTRRLLANPDIERWVSVVSLWEIAVKVQMGKLAMPIEGAFYLRHLQALKAQTLAVSLPHSLALLGLPPHHRDPFDRLLIAQANEEGLTLVSRDEAFRAYDVARLW
jgi:PIN domain nuclease of toxin-antitoxin system